MTDSAITQPVLINGEWRASVGTRSFRAHNPKTREATPDSYPVSPWPEIDEAMRASARAFEQLRWISPDQIAAFLDKFADLFEERRSRISELAELETALAREPRLNSVELPRTTGQLRQAAAAARDRSWSMPTIDTENNVRAMFSAIGPIVVFGPNNFPMAFGSASGGDFAAAIAAGNPVIAKANSSHPGTTRLLAEAANDAAAATAMPAAMVQLLYRTDHDDGKKLVSHPLIGATGYTGSRSAGLALKEAADKAGKLIYLELSSINPVVILPGAIRERADDLANEFITSAFMGTGQFCTNPGVVLLLEHETTAPFVSDVQSRFNEAPVGTLLSEGVEQSMTASIEALKSAGATVVTGGSPGGGEGYSFNNTLLQVTAAAFLTDPEALQCEAFGNASLFVIADDTAQLQDVINSLEGNLTGCVYSDTGGSDDAVYDEIAPLLRTQVGRLLNDKMPTGVLVSPAMNHGGPYPATAHAGFTAVGIPASLRRFAALQCYDAVRPNRLPPELQDINPTASLWRLIDGQWTRNHVGA